MIPDKNRPTLLERLSALGGTEEQVREIGNILFTVCALDASRDAEFLLEASQTQRDPVVRRAISWMLAAL